MWTARELTERSQILSVLETDRLYAAYAIGDLEPGMFEHCTWFGAEEAGQLRSLVLLYRGLTPPALFLMGDVDGLRAILGGDRFPQHVYLTCLQPCLEMTRDFYAWERATPMWRMTLPGGERARFRNVAGNCIPLTPAHAEQLTQLFTLGGGLAFGPEQIARGVFYGVLVADRLVSVAGTHPWLRTIRPRFVSMSGWGLSGTVPFMRGLLYVLPDLARTGHLGKALRTMVRYYRTCPSHLDRGWHPGVVLHYIV